MAEDLLKLLTSFHREVVVPDIERIVEERVDTRASRTDERMASGFDGMVHVLSRLDSEVAALKTGVQRLEQRMAQVEERLAAVDEKLDKVALRAELIELREMAITIEHRISEIEASLQ